MLNHLPSMGFFFGSLISLLTITNPLSKIPLFIALSRDMAESHRRRQARRACLYAFVILTVSLFLGGFILEQFGVSYGALRIAGGITIAVLGYRMLFNVDETTSSRVRARDSIAFFPLALPGISGPGAIAVVVGMSTEIAELQGAAAKAAAYAETVTSIVVTCCVVWVALRSSQWVLRVMGTEGLDAMSRLMGFLLVCVGVQFVGSGIRTFMAGS